ncbi:unnamed protein product [Anisakis simplex]|uniref:Protein kinase domain-containing protein n=1 Tax=Anisakis simplex TaxID=6269 RepID=A0A0M3JN45_ANISI|nr:unnamed protein product [Anisakis simplex]
MYGGEECYVKKFRGKRLFIKDFGPEHIEEADKEELMTSTKKVLHLVAPFIVNTFAYPYTLVSTIMACTGSG